MSFYVISAATILLPATAYLVLKQKPLSGLYWLGVFILFSVLSETFFTVTALSGIHNIQYFHIYQFFEFLFLYLFFSGILDRKPFKDLWGLWGILVLAFLVLNPLLIEGWMVYNSIAASIVSIHLMVFAFMYFYKLYQDEQVINLLEDPSFLMVAALFLYFSIGFVVVLNYKFAILKTSSFLGYWDLKNIGNIFKNLILTYAFWLNRRNPSLG